MTITINGSGTLSGISTGGISDTKAVTNAAVPAGSIVKVVPAESDTSHSNTSDTYTDIGLSASITLSNANNKVLILGSINYLVKRNYYQTWAGYRLLRGTTEIQKGPDGVSGGDDKAFEIGFTQSNNDTYAELAGRYNTHVVDAPGSVGPHTYKFQSAQKSSSATPVIITNVPNTSSTSGADPKSYITLMEITV
tara:strand:- start:977 stop:1558 length:582 start_codon:yes stop_codon:yes gene_type:complete